MQSAKLHIKIQKFLERRKRGGKKLMKRYLVVVFLLIVGMTIVVKAGDIKSPEVEIKAIIVEIPSYELEKLGIDQNKILEGGTTYGFNINPEKFQIFKNKLQTGEIEAKVGAPPTLKTISGYEGTVAFRGDVHYMQKVGDNLYKLRTINDIGIIFTATPVIENDIIVITLKLQVNDVGKRQVLPEAPDLKVGIPLTTSRQISTTVSVKDGETVLVGGISRKDEGKDRQFSTHTLSFITANIIRH